VRTKKATKKFAHQKLVKLKFSNKREQEKTGTGIKAHARYANFRQIFSPGIFVGRFWGDWRSAPTPCGVAPRLFPKDFLQLFGLWLRF
jgi:hypothetical protein